MFLSVLFVKFKLNLNQLRDLKYEYCLFTDYTSLQSIIGKKQSWLEELNAEHNAYRDIGMCWTLIQEERLQ